MKQLNLFGLFILIINLFPLFCLSNCSIFYTSIPKCGNFLLGKCLELMTGKKNKHSYNRLFLNEEQIKHLSHNFILDSHAFFTNKNVNIINNNNLKGIFIYRDPRDQIVSFTFYIYRLCNESSVFRSNLGYLVKLKFNDLLSLLIHNYDFFYALWNINYNIKPFKLGNILEKNIHINDIYKKYDGWKKNKLIYVTTFEKLVGPKGKGNLSVQIKEIKNIANHLNIQLTKEKLNYILNNLFGGTATFREGQIGGWKKYFNKKHKQDFKKVAGDLLIKLGYEKNYNW